MVKFLVVTGGVISGLGKGITISSLGLLLKASGVHVTSIKIDPYLNIDAGTMSPYEHGEVYVLNDGAECDLDLGNYERYLDLTLTRDHNLTTGRVFQSVLERERRGDYLGKTVQMVPHVTDAIQEWLARVSKIPVDGSDVPPEVCLVELGGTVGDIESAPFLEALRQFQFKVGKDNWCHAHVSLVPIVGGEQKTKPTQHGVKDLMGLGFIPDLLVCRCATELSEAVKTKLSMFCHVPAGGVLSVHDVPDLYHVPLLLASQGAHEHVMRRLGITPRQDPMTSSLMTKWRAMLAPASRTVRIALVGKYTTNKDAYLSVVKALEHAAFAAHVALSIVWVEASELEDSGEVEKGVETVAVSGGVGAAWDALRSCDGVLVPGGFGDRGRVGKMIAIHYARTVRVPFLGVCYGFQLAVLEYTRNVLGVVDATSAEFESSPSVAVRGRAVIVSMPEASTTHLGGTMRLGVRETTLMPGPSHARELYGNADSVMERHRHRYEVDPAFVDTLESRGELRFTGKGDGNKRMEILELAPALHPYFFATQYHPEFLSRPQRPSPPFYGLLRAAAARVGSCADGADDVAAAAAEK